MPYNCERCFDNGYYISMDESINYGTYSITQRESKPCLHCNKGEQFGTWLKLLRTNPDMSNDYDAWYQKNSIEGYIV
jgi:hypothetical protein